MHNITIDNNMPWFFLIIAGIFEIIWAVGMKYCDGLRITMPSLIVICAMTCSVVFLALAMKHIPIGTAYAVWTSIGIFGVACYGIIILHEPISFLRILFLTMILGGVIGLKMITQ